MQRITITLPKTVLHEVDRKASNRSRFVLNAIRRELRRRRREGLRRSLEAPHEESNVLAEAGLDAWASSLPDERAADLVEPGVGRPVRWIRGAGWQVNEP